MTPVLPALSTDYQTLCWWVAQKHVHDSVTLWLCILLFHTRGMAACVSINGGSNVETKKSNHKRHLSCGVKTENWFVRVGGASPLLAERGRPVLGWKNTTDFHEMKHTINGHLSWITRSKNVNALPVGHFIYLFTHLCTYLTFPLQSWREPTAALPAHRSFLGSILDT